MTFDNTQLIDKAKRILSVLSPGLPNVKILTAREHGVEIKKIAEQTLNRTAAGQFYYTTKRRARSVPETVWVGGPQKIRGLSADGSVRESQEKLLEQAPALLEKVGRYITKAPLCYYQAAVAENRQRLRAGLNLYVGAMDKANVKLILNTHVMFPRPDRGERFTRQFTLLDLPEFPEPAILVFPDLHFTIVLGTDYYGEVKKGFFRMLWYEASFRGILGIHASLKVVTTLKDKEIAVVTFGLSGTGKTTTVIYNQISEGSQRIFGDDFFGLDADFLAIWGTEKGIFPMTRGITKEEQPDLYVAMTDPRAVYENVFVNAEGQPDFCNLDLTANGRCIIPRDALPYEIISDGIDKDRLDLVARLVFLLLSRSNFNPGLQRLTPEQFAAAFALGHTTGTPAGGKAEAGKNLFIEGTNPFILRPPGHDATLFLASIRKLIARGIAVECLVHNTGYTGQVTDDHGNVIRPGFDIGIECSSKLLAACWEDELAWQKNPITNTEVPASCAGVPAQILNPQLAFAGFKNFLRKGLLELNRQRQECLKAMAALDPEILHAGLEMYPVDTK